MAREAAGIVKTTTSKAEFDYFGSENVPWIPSPQTGQGAIGLRHDTGSQTSTYDEGIENDSDGSGTKAVLLLCNGNRLPEASSDVILNMNPSVADITKIEEIAPISDAYGTWSRYKLSVTTKLAGILDRDEKSLLIRCNYPSDIYGGANIGAVRYNVCYDNNFVESITFNGSEDNELTTECIITFRLSIPTRLTIAQLTSHFNLNDIGNTGAAFNKAGAIIEGNELKIPITGITTTGGIVIMPMPNGYSSGHHVDSEGVLLGHTVYYGDPPAPEVDVVDFVLLKQGNSTTVHISEDAGETFQDATMPGAAIQWADCCYGPGKGFVAVCGYSALNTRGAFSTDGKVWEAITMPSSARWATVAFKDGRFVALAGGSSGTSTVCAYSDDGQNWELGSGLPNCRWQKVVATPSGFLAIASSGTGRIARSADGVTWSAAGMSIPAQTWLGLAYGNGHCVAACESGPSMFSVDDGNTWAELTGGDAESYMFGCAFGNNRFVLTNDYEGAYVSQDGETINGETYVLATPADGTIWRVGFGAGFFLIVGEAATSAIYKVAEPTAATDDDTEWDRPAAQPVGGYRNVCGTSAA